MKITQKFYDFIVLLNSKYSYIMNNASELIEEGEDWRSFFKKDILKYIRSIKDYDLKELCIFFTDDFLAKKTEWSEFLIEKTILKTNSGGSLFYDRLNTYLDSHDADMAKCYLIALKAGFNGYKSNPLQNEYDSCLFRFRSYSEIKTESMLRQYESDLLVPRGNKALGLILLLVVLIMIPIFVKVYYIIVTFKHLNACYASWGY